MARFKVRDQRAIADNIYLRSTAGLPVIVTVDGKQGQPLSREQISGVLLWQEVLMGNADLHKDCIPEGVDVEEDESEAPKKKSKDKGKKKSKKSKG